MLIAGVDEVGRGPLAGPVVTAAVIIQAPISGVTDSKILTAKVRETLSREIEKKAIAYAFGRAEVHEIDQLNIHHATLLAMRRAIEALPVLPDMILVDGLHHPSIDIKGKTNLQIKAVVKGDLSVYEIGAASILAKVARDAEMRALDRLYPGYGFADNKGYPTKAHLQALRTLGPSSIHRQSFQPVANARLLKES